jgi:hypothetical protein
MFEQPVAVAIFLAAHGAKFVGLLGIIFLETGRKVFVDAGIFFFE